MTRSSTNSCVTRSTPFPFRIRRAMALPILLKGSSSVDGSPRLRNRFYNDYYPSGSTVTMEESSQDEKRRDCVGLRIQDGPLICWTASVLPVNLQALSPRQA